MGAKLRGLIVSGLVLVVGTLVAVVGGLLGWWSYAGAIVASALIVLAAGWLPP